MMENDIEYRKVKGHDNLSRDMTSQAIVNTNNGAYNAARKRAADAQHQRDEIRNATREINNIKSELHDIKSMLLELTKR